MQLFYENKIGERLDLLNAHEYALTAATGLASLPSNSLSTVETVFLEGDSVQFRRRTSRTITLTHRFLHDVKKTRRRFLNILDQGSAGRIVYQDESLDVFLEVEVENCEVANTDEYTTAVTSFMAPFPYFRDSSETVAGNKAVMGAWRFPFAFPVTFGAMQAGNAIEIDNAGGISQGFTARMTANGGTVTNPSLSNHMGKAFVYERSIEDGESVEVCTVAGVKSATKITAAGVESDALYWLSPESQMFPLEIGRNMLKPSADSGLEFLDVEISFTPAHKGV